MAKCRFTTTDRICLYREGLVQLDVKNSPEYRRANNHGYVRAGCDKPHWNALNRAPSHVESEEAYHSATAGLYLAGSTPASEAIWPISGTGIGGYRFRA
jgi:hypothetical protein